MEFTSSGIVAVISAVGAASVSVFTWLQGRDSRISTVALAGANTAAINAMQTTTASQAHSMDEVTKLLNIAFTRIDDRMRDIEQEVRDLRDEFH